MSLLISRFEKFASEFPQAPFSKDSQNCVNYGEAYSQTKRVASWIRQQVFFDAKQPIFTYFESKAAYLPIILGSMHSGMPWVGLDPNLPSGHNRRILSLVSDPKVIVPREYQARAKDALNDAVLIDPADITDGLDRSNTLLIDPDSTALITFTSGTTDMPKGVVRSHRQISENAFAQSKAFGLRPNDCLAGGYSPNVMGFLRAFLNILSAGGCYRPALIREQGEDGIVSAVNSFNVNVLHIVAPIFRKIFSTIDDKSIFANVDKLILGGDAATPQDLEIFRRLFGQHAAIYSGLGSSEAGSISVWQGNRDFQPDREKLPCGALLPNVSVLMDCGGIIKEPVENEVGELLVSSPGIAKGYWQNEKLEDQKWVQVKGRSTYYRTGDLVAFDEVEELHHFGRVDSSHKISGVLVDPFYIESVLERYDAIDEVAVEIRPGNQRARLEVEAFLVLNSELDKTNFQSFMDEQLIGAAHPTILYEMTALPRNSNGKILRLSLDRSSPLSKHSRKSGSVEPGLNSLRSIWAETLEISEVKDDCSFVELGGDSLSVIVLALEIEREFGVRFTVQEIAGLASLHDMSQAIAAKKDGQKTEIRLQPTELLYNAVSTWRGKQVEESGLIRQLNQSKGKRIYWCLQSEIEYTTLSEAFGDKLNLRAMRSLNLLAARTPENLKSVSEAYAEAILNAESDCTESLNLGGNCQGSELMLKVAHVLHNNGIEINHFFMMEKFFNEPIPFPVTVLFGKESERNTYRTGELTLEYATEMYPKLRGIYEVSGKHGQFFAPNNIRSISERVLSELIPTEPARFPGKSIGWLHGLLQRF